MTENSQSVSFTLPNPPSLNRLWANIPGKGRVRTRQYRSWAVLAGWELKIQMFTKNFTSPLACRYDMEIQVPISRRDTGNWEKPLSDLLQHMGVITNDGNVNRLAIVPTNRTDCLITLSLLPDMDGVRPAPEPKVTLSTLLRTQ